MFMSHKKPPFPCDRFKKERIHHGAHSAAEPQPNRFCRGRPRAALRTGTHEGCPYKRRKMFAKKTRNYGLVLQANCP